MIREFTYAAAVLQAFLCTAALACDGQVGKVIFEDTFADDSGGWDLSPPVETIKPPDFVIALNSKYSSGTSQVLTFHATDADYCAEFTMPKSIAPDNRFGFGVEFWAVDNSNFWMAMLTSDGTVGLYSRANATWQTIASVPNAPGLKTDPDAVNALRVTTTGGKISVYLNGQPVKAIRAQVPDGSLRFGVYAQMDKGVDGAGPMIVKSFKVTSGQ